MKSSVSSYRTRNGRSSLWMWGTKTTRNISTWSSRGRCFTKKESLIGIDPNPPHTTNASFLRKTKKSSSTTWVVLNTEAFTKRKRLMISSWRGSLNFWKTYKKAKKNQKRLTIKFTTGQDRRTVLFSSSQRKTKLLLTKLGRCPHGPGRLVNDCILAAKKNWFLVTTTTGTPRGLNDRGFTQSFIRTVSCESTWPGKSKSVCFSDFGGRKTQCRPGRWSCWTTRIRSWRR